MPRKILLLLVSILVFGFVLRVLYLPQGAVNFMYDQARDAYAVREIIDGNFKILGPPSSSQGLSHGVFYYYLIAPAYKIGGGDPVVVSYWLAFINILGGVVVFFLARALTRKDMVGLIAAFLYAISFETTQYATWLSNPGIGVVTVPVLYLGLWQWINSSKSSEQVKKWGPALAALGLGISIQSQIFLLYHTVPVLVVLALSRKNVKPREIFIFCGFFLASLATMLIAEIKFGFQSTKGLLGMVTSGNDVAVKNPAEQLILYLTLFLKSLSRSIVANNLNVTATLVLAIVLTSLASLKKKKLTPEIFTLIYLLSLMPVFLKVGDNIPHLFVGLAPALHISLAILVYRMWQSKIQLLAVGILLLITYSNLLAITKENKKGQTLLATQKSMIIGNQKSLIDKTYESRKPFSINNVTAPLYINITWTYLYKWYGEAKYGYLPTYAGKGQDGQLDALPQSGDIKDSHFLVIEPLWGIPRRYKDEIIGEEDSRSTLVSEIEYGELVLQERKKTIN